MKKITVLILGATGMVGNTMYEELSKNKLFYAIGTSRKGTKFEKFSVDNAMNDSKMVLERHKNIDYVINCIGLTQETTPVVDLIKVNSLFPHSLLSYIKGSQLIHISTDAVYSKDAGNADELTKPDAESFYAASKLLGEVYDKRAINIRTSILGVSKNKNTSLLDWARNTKLTKIDGYVNQNWSGCTSLQLSKFCVDLILMDHRIKGKFGSVVNFAPLQKLSKYKILITAKKVGIIDKEIIKAKNQYSRTRNIHSIYFDNKYLERYTCDIFQALKELYINSTQYD